MVFREIFPRNIILRSIGRDNVLSRWTSRTWGNNAETHIYEHGCRVYDGACI